MRIMAIGIPDILHRFMRCKSGSIDTTIAIVSKFVIVSVAVSPDIFLTSDG